MNTRDARSKKHYFFMPPPKARFEGMSHAKRLLLGPKKGHRLCATAARPQRDAFGVDEVIHFLRGLLRARRAFLRRHRFATLGPLALGRRGLRRWRPASAQRRYAAGQLHTLRRRTCEAGQWARAPPQRAYNEEPRARELEPLIDLRERRPRSPPLRLAAGCA